MKKHEAGNQQIHAKQVIIGQVNGRIHGQTHVISKKNRTIGIIIKNIRQINTPNGNNIIKYNKMDINNTEKIAITNNTTQKNT